MNDNEQSSSKTRPPGTRRATLAVLISVAALGFSIYGLAHQVMDQETEAVSQVTPETPPAVADEGLRDRLGALENRQGQFAEDMAKIMAKMDEIAKTPLAAAIPSAPEDVAKGSVEDMKRKLAEIEKNNATLQNEIATALQKKAGLLSDLSLTQSIRRKLQDGMNFSSERRRLSKGDGLQALDSIASPAEVSDRALRDDLRELAPQFSAADKLEEAEGFLQKLMLRAQSLVTLRPREGIAQDTDTGKVLASVEGQIMRHDWKGAQAAANTVSVRAPADFANWMKRLEARAAAEAAIDRLEDTALTALRDDNHETPSAFPASMQEEPSAPAKKPVAVGPSSSAEDEQEANP